MKEERGYMMKITHLIENRKQQLYRIIKISKQKFSFYKKELKVTYQLVFLEGFPPRTQKLYHLNGKFQVYFQQTFDLVDVGLMCNQLMILKINWAKCVFFFLKGLWDYLYWNLRWMIEMNNDYVPKLTSHLLFLKRNQIVNCLRCF